MTEEWKVQTYGSGTMIVSRFLPGQPHYYVYGPRSDDDKQYMHDRHKVCEDLRDHLNGGPRPAWLDDLARTSDDHAEALDYTSIDAVGPMIDRTPPTMDWVTDDSPEATRARKELMDRLFGERTDR